MLSRVRLDGVLRGESNGCCPFHSKFSSFRPPSGLFTRQEPGAATVSARPIYSTARVARWRVTRPSEQSRSEYKQKHAFDFVLVFEIWSYAMSCPQPKKKILHFLATAKKKKRKF